MIKVFFTQILFFLFITNCFSQKFISGVVVNQSNGKPIEFVNIGVLGKNLGTVSSEKGAFVLKIDSGYNTETLLFSMIGFQPLSIKISDFNNESKKIIMQEQNYNLNEVVIKPKIFIEKILGIKTTNKHIQAGFSENQLGYELGVMMKNKKLAHVKTVHININYCIYDTIFYRLNIYNSKFENILKEPIYIKFAKDQLKETISVDLTSKNIITEGDFLVSLEHIKDLGKGGLYFCASFGKKMYFRKTSQANWIPFSTAGVSISVVADVEK